MSQLGQDFNISSLAFHGEESFQVQEGLRDAHRENWLSAFAVTKCWGLLKPG